MKISMIYEKEVKVIRMTRNQVEQFIVNHTDRMKHLIPWHPDNGSLEHGPSIL